jgi:hypothetical protein
VLFLVFPFPVLASETTTYERIADNGQNQTTLSFDYGGVSWNRLDIHDGDCGSTTQAVHFNMQSAADGTLTMTFPESDVSAAGFLSGCVNDPYTVTWNYSDGTSKTENFSAQSNGNVSAMFENITHSITGKYITSVAVVYDDYVIVDDIFWTYGTPVTTTTTSTTTTSTTTTSTTTTTVPVVKPPINVSVAFITYNGADGLLVDWELSNEGNINPERYAVGFGSGSCCGFAIATGNVGDASALETSQFFSFSYLEAVFGSQYGDFYFKVRSDNDSQSLYSSFTDPVQHSVTVPTTTTTSTTTTTLPPAPVVIPEPEPEPEPIVELILIGDVEVEFTEDEIADGTVDREKERQKNLDSIGCDATDAQVERGDCGDVDILENTEMDENLETDTFDLEDLSDEELEELELQAQEDAELIQEELEKIEKEIEDEIRKELEISGSFFDGPVEELTDEELEKIDILIDQIIFIEESVDFDDFELPEDEVFEIFEVDPDIVIVFEEPKNEEPPPPIIEIFDEGEDEVIVEPVEGDIKEPTENEIVFTQDEIVEVEQAVEELVEVIEAAEDAIPEIPNEITEDLSEDQVEAVVDTYVETLEVEAVVEIIKDVVEVGLEELSDEQVAVVAAVVESAVDDVAELSTEQVETVAEVLGLDDSQDVAVLAANVQEDEAVAEAVDSFVERAASEENKDVENYNVADAVVEYQTEEFLANPTVIFQVDLQEISFAALDQGMTLQQKEKSQEVVVPVIIASQIVSAAVVPYRRKT